MQDTTFPPEPTNEFSAANMTSTVPPMANATPLNTNRQYHGSDYDTPVVEVRPISVDLISLASNVPALVADLYPGAADSLLTNVRSSQSEADLRCVCLYTNRTTTSVLVVPSGYGTDDTWSARNSDCHRQTSAFSLINRRVLRHRHTTLKFETRLWPSFAKSKEALLELIDHQQRGQDSLLCAARLISPLRNQADINLFFHKSPSNSTSELVCLSFPRKDQMRLDRIPDNEWDEIQPLLKRFWKQGMTCATNDEGTIRHLTMNGNPWDRVNCLLARVIVMGTLQQLYRQGWKKCVPVPAVTSGTNRTDSLVLVREAVFVTSPEQSVPSFCCIALGGVNRIRIIGQGDTRTKRSFVRAVEMGWRKGVQKYAATDDDTMEMILKGSPFKVRSSVSDSIASGILFCYILERMLRKGWKYFCSVSLSFNKADKPSILFVRDGNAQKGKVGCVSFSCRGLMTIVGMPRQACDSIQELVERRGRPWLLHKRVQRGDDFILCIDLEPSSCKVKTKPKKVEICSLMNHALQQLEKVGGHLIGTINLSEQNCAFESFFFHFE